MKRFCRCCNPKALIAVIVIIVATVVLLCCLPLWVFWAGLSVGALICAWKILKS